MDACDDIDLNSRRTRINIAVSCISTIFLCTWVAFHPNIPAPGELKWKVIRRKIGCMIGGILAPEIYVLLAARQFIAARYIADKYREEGWTVTHGFFALMGGFMAHYSETTTGIVFFGPNVIEHDTVFIRDFTSLEAFERRLAALRLESPHHSLLRRGSGHFVHIIGALENIKSQLQQIGREFHGKWVEEVQLYNHYLALDKLDWIHAYYATSPQARCKLKNILSLLEAFEQYTLFAVLGISKNIDHTLWNENAGGTEGSTSKSAFESSRLPSLVPRINEQDIQDKSKSDMLTKTIALFQVAWFNSSNFAQAISNEEPRRSPSWRIFTLAFCVLNFATYALWWKKPFAVARGYAIRLKDDDWEVIAPPFVETEEVPWYRQCWNWMRGDTKGIKQVLALRPS
ncbi:hypothetical protein NLI96_g12071 [Meripilus lineatus]|uniref:Uncharacterized protein n=1 Tax=Meripilus lineatus TaxID=2056292 RepID=A0AAD5UT25_9APHY|nr:hypothetical protein NLI96_g12071 [Physisporinus lineatus]